MVATTMKAFMTRSLRSPALYTIPTPTPTPSEILITVAFVSLNPTDHKHASLSLPPSKIIGCDFSGTVTSTPNPPCDLKKGDRVAGVIHGCKDSHTGGFAEYLTADPGMCFRVPAEVPLEEACTLGVGWVSAAQTLQQRLFKGYKPSDGSDGKGMKGKDALLVYSAASNTGMHTIQQARLLYPAIYIIAVASSQHHPRMRDLGADACFDYHSASIERDVRALGKSVTRAIDCHSEGSSTVLCAGLMDEGSRIVRTLPPGMMRGQVPKGVRADEWILSYTALGKVLMHRSWTS